MPARIVANLKSPKVKWVEVFTFLMNVDPTSALPTRRVGRLSSWCADRAKMFQGRLPDAADIKDGLTLQESHDLLGEGYWQLDTDDQTLQHVDGQAVDLPDELQKELEVATAGHFWKATCEHGLIKASCADIVKNADKDAWSKIEKPFFIKEMPKEMELEGGLGGKEPKNKSPESTEEAKGKPPVPAEAEKPNEEDPEELPEAAASPGDPSSEPPEAPEELGDEEEGEEEEDQEEDAVVGEAADAPQDEPIELEPEAAEHPEPSLPTTVRGSAARFLASPPTTPRVKPSAETRSRSRRRDTEVAPVPIARTVQAVNVTGRLEIQTFPDGRKAQVGAKYVPHTIKHQILASG
eukprot:s5254_g3.t1